MSANGGITYAAGTVVTSDYLPWARVLADSFAAHNPRARFVVAVLDEPNPAQLRPDDRFELVGAADIGLSGAEYDWMTTIYDGFELSCAVKPLLLRHLLILADAALYLDADILICASLAEIAEQAKTAGLLLSPHTLEPLPRDGLLPDDDVLLRSGQFNGGFVAVGRQGVAFLDWWRDRLARECVVGGAAEPERFVDQRFLDLAVNYFPSAILRDRGANVAYWNLATRSLELGPDGYAVDSGPLLFMHFSGFDPFTPHVLSKHAGQPERVTVAGCPALAQLCRDYTKRLELAGLQPAGGGKPVPELAPGIPLTPPVRRAVRAALIDGERSSTAPLSGPRDPEALWAWLRASVTPNGMSWYLWGLWQSQPALRRQFPRVPGPDEDRYLDWAAHDGVELTLVIPGLAQRAQPVQLHGAHGFTVLTDASELLADPSLLAGLADSFCASDDMTLVIRAGGRDPQRLERDLEPLLGTLGLDGPDSPDMLGLVDPVGPRALAPVVDAVLTRRPADRALAHLPHADAITSLRATFDVSHSHELAPSQT
jgi:hypothetical protein